MRRHRGTLALTVLALWSAPARAQDPLEWALDRSSDIATLDLSVPPSPAFTVLGLTPDTVVRPSTPRDLAASLLNGVDPQGNLQTGLALDTSPYMLLYGGDMTLRDYRTGTFAGLPNWFLASIQTSLATAKGTSDDDDAVRVGLGFRATPWNRGDPRRDDGLAACVAGAHDMIHKRLDALTPTDILALQKLEADLGVPRGDILERLRQMEPTERRKKVSEELERKLEWLDDDTGPLVQVNTCLEEARERNWNASAWDIGAAPSWIAESGQFGDLSSNGGAVWTSLALGRPYDSRKAMDAEKDAGLRFLRRNSQLILHARYRLDQQVADDSVPSGFHEQDDFLLGGRLRFGIPRVAVSLEGAYVSVDPDEGDQDDGFRFGVIGEVRLMKDVWLNLSFGGQEGGGDADGEGFVMSSLKYGFGSEPTFDIRQP